MSQGSVLIFASRPIAAVITAAALLLFALPVLGPLVRRLRLRPSEATRP
jgi:TctA family transporter